MSARPAPLLGDELKPAHPSTEALDWLLTRRSTVAGDLTGPGPDSGQLDLILRAASRVPDHRKLAPFRFLVIEGEARSRAGDHLASAFQAEHPDAPEERIAFEGARFERAPVVVAVISSPVDDGKTPDWEQRLVAGSVCQTLLLAAQASGFAGQWLTEWYAYDDTVLSALGLSEGEKIAGFIYLGTAEKNPAERARPELSDLVSRY